MSTPIYDRVRCTTGIDPLHQNSSVRYHREREFLIHAPIGAVRKRLVPKQKVTR